MQQDRRLALAFVLLLVSCALCVTVVSAKGLDYPVRGSEHRQVVSSTVHNLLDVAKRERLNIGKEVKEVVASQEETKDKVAEALDKISSRSKIKTFLLGSDYKNIGMVRSEMVKTRNQIEQLKRIAEKSSYNGKKKISADAATLEKQAQDIEAYLKANEGRFSLFGWAMKFSLLAQSRPQQQNEAKDNAQKQRNHL